MGLVAMAAAFEKRNTLQRIQRMRKKNKNMTPK